MLPSSATSPTAEPSPVKPADDSGLMEGALTIWQEFAALLHDCLHLAVLETKLAGQNFLMMIALALLVAMLVGSAWLGLVAAAIISLIHQGVWIGNAVLLGVLANLVAALVLGMLMRNRSRHLQWAATLRTLRPVPSVKRQPATS